MKATYTSRICLFLFYCVSLSIFELLLLFLNFRGIAHKAKCVGILHPYFLSRLFPRSKSQGYIDLVKPFGPSGCLHPGRQNSHILMWTTGIDMPYFSHTGWKNALIHWCKMRQSVDKTNSCTYIKSEITVDDCLSLSSFK